MLRFIVPFLALAVFLRGQQFDNPVSIPISYYGETFKTLFGTSSFSFGSEIGETTTASAGGAAGFAFYSPLKQATLVPGKEYVVKVLFSNLNFVNIHFNTPANTTLYVNGFKSRTIWGGGNGTTTTFRLRLEAGADIVNSLAGHRSGDCTSIVEDKPIWYLGLGSLRNGQLAGALGIRAADISDDLFTTSALLCDSVADDEVTTERTNGYITKVTSPEAVVTVDAYDASSSSYGIRVFTKNDLVTPYVTYTIRKQTVLDANGATIGTGVRIDRAEDSKTWSTLLKKVGGTWTLYDWRVTSPTADLDTANPIVTVVAGTTSTVNYGAATGLTIKQKTYTTVNSQTELGEVVLGTGVIYAPKTSYSYYTDSTGDNWSGALKTLDDPAGGWTKYDYYNTANNSIAGQVKRVYRPWLDEVADAASATTSNCEVDTYTYTANYDGTTSAVASRETTIKGTTVAKSTWDYNWGFSADTNGHKIAQIVEHAHTQSSVTNSLTTTTLAYREDDSASFFWGKLHAVTRPNGSKDAYGYFAGTWDAASKSFTASASGNDRLILSFHGQTTAGPGAQGISLSSWSVSNISWAIDSVYMLPNRSTVSETVIDAAGHAVFAAENVFVHSPQGVDSLERISATAFTFDSHNRLYQKSDVIRSTVETYLYEGDRLDTLTAADGVVTKYKYDDFLRLETTTIGDGGTAEYPAKIRSTAYDAANRAQSTYTCSCGTAAVSFTYDNAGRVEHKKERSPNSGEELDTAYVYPNATTTEVTLPTKATRNESHYLDGRPKAVTGSAQPATSYSYTVNSTGLNVTRIDGDATVNTWTTTQSDWLGRTTQSTRPTYGWNSTDAKTKTVTVESTYDTTTGELTKQTTTDDAAIAKLLPDHLFVYGYPGLMTAEGSDLDSNGSLETTTNDRFRSLDAYYSKDASGWTAVATATGYAILNDETATQLKKTTARLTGFSGGQTAETVATDANGRSTTTTESVDSAQKTRTTTVSIDGVTNSSSAVTTNGYLSAKTLPTGEKIKNTYDGYGRLYTVSSRWDGTAFGAVDIYAYWSQTDFLKKADVGGVENTTSYSWDTAAHTRTVTVTDQAGNASYTLYNEMDLPKHVGGAAAQAIEFGYDSLGRRTSQKTWRSRSYDESNWPATGAATTSWQPDPSTGLITKKKYADDNHVDFTYTPLGSIKTRKWARGVTTTYSYFDGATGSNAGVSYGTQELAGITYDDNSTPSVSFTYKRSGNLDTVTDAAGTRTLGYATAQPFRLANETLGDFYSGKVRALEVDSYGRGKGFKLGTTSVAAADLSQIGTFVAATGALSSITTASQGGADRSFTYEYRDYSGLVDNVHVGTNKSANFAAVFDYDSTSVARRAKSEGTWIGNSVARFDLAYDNRGLLKTAAQSGSAFSDYYSGLSYSSVFNAHAHNARGELTTSAMYRGAPSETDAPSAADELPGRRFEYRYDGAGNRASAGFSGDAATGDDSYVANDLNQYDSRTNKFVRVLGSAAKSANIATLDFLVSKVDRSFGLFVTPTNSNGPASGTVKLYVGLPGAGANGGDLFTTQDKTWFAPARGQSFSYDQDGNLKNDGLWEYTYDGENRLVKMTALSAAQSAGFQNRTLEFQYDYMGRRIQKHAVNAMAGTDVTLRFAYDGWNLVAEYSVSGSTLALARSYTWGLDVTGSASATGGVGALLQVVDHGAGQSFGVSYDGNGNVATLVNLADGTLGATYEYSPYGELLRSAGDYASTNPFRFSTKFTDAETSLVYYGHRYYIPVLGRFINRDPIQEAGGLNLYGFCGNMPIDRIDLLGRDDETIKLPDYTVFTEKAAFGLADWMQQMMLARLARYALAGPISMPIFERITDGTFTAPIAAATPTGTTRCAELAAKYPDAFKKAGEPIKSPLNAFVAATIHAGAESEIGSEFFSNIFKNQDGTYSFTDPMPTIGMDMGGGTVNIEIPSGTKRIGITHGHNVGRAAYIQHNLYQSRGAKSLEQVTAEIPESLYLDLGEYFSAADMDIPNYQAFRNTPVVVGVFTPSGAIRAFSATNTNIVMESKGKAGVLTKGYSIAGAPSPQEALEIVKCLKNK